MDREMKIVPGGKTYIITVGPGLKEIIESEASKNPVLNTSEWICSRLAELLMSGKVLVPPDNEENARRSGYEIGYEAGFHDAYNDTMEQLNSILKYEIQERYIGVNWMHYEGENG